METEPTPAEGSRHLRIERLAIIGFGAIGRLLVERLPALSPAPQLVAVVTRPASVDAVRKALPDTVKACAGLAEALETRPTLFVECAGHAALCAYALDILRAKVDLLVASVGALANAEFELGLRAAAEASGARVLLPAGAVGGLDALAAGRIAGLESVDYTSTKPVHAWRNTHAERLIDLAAVTEPTVLFTGSAREAARLFPQNANVAATIALAGIGFDRTTVNLLADPAAKGNQHRIRAAGAFGTLEFRIEGRTLPSNTKTSLLAPLSLLRALESRQAAVRIV